MNNQTKCKSRWIYKFQILCKRRFLIFNITLLLILLFIISFIIVLVFSFQNIYYVMPSIILPISMVYPHAINKRRLEQLYVDLPKEIKPEYERFINKYVANIFLIQWLPYKLFKLDRDKIIALVKNYKEKKA